MPAIYRKIAYVVLALVGVQMSACSSKRYLTENQTLFTGSEININDSSLSTKKVKALKSDLGASVRPRPNASFFGIRYKLLIYNLAGDPAKESGIRKWLRKNGEPPVLGSDVHIEANNKILVNQLHNQGFFDADVQGLKQTKGKETKAIFDVKTGAQSYIGRVIYEPSDTSRLSRDLDFDPDSSFLKQGQPYNLEAIKRERLRIDNQLKNKGYYFFNPDYILLDADTGLERATVDLTVKMKYSMMPARATLPYSINEVVVRPNYRLNDMKDSNTVVSIDERADTVIYSGFKVVDPRRQFRPYVFRQAMQFKPGELYNKTDQNISLNRLVTLGTFKFVKNEFREVAGEPGKLDVTYLLTPYAVKALNAELGGFTQDDSRGGLKASVGWRNRNFLKGAEIFTVKLTGSYEAQYGGVSQRPNVYNFGVEANLNVPRFIVPFFDIRPSGMYIPRTIMSAAYNYSRRTGFYKINTLAFGYGYNWKENAAKDHKLFPFNLTLVKTDTINQLKADSFNFANLFYNGIILGPTYEFTYNSQLYGRNLKNNFYFYGQIDLSGNLLGLAQGASPESPKEIFGANYAQYLKVQLDGRYYRTLTPKSVLAMRLMMGYGYSYGNSTTMPNVKQFFSGGSSSLRGFSSRLVGPGTYNERFARGTGRQFEILGDIKTEMNLEYRPRIYRFIEGAVFFDAGNIWLLRENEQDFPGGKFTKNFYKELAVDAGLGIRLDFTILMLRLDFAFPIRKPWLPEGQRWTLNDLNFGDPQWRKENLFFNLAIGYPF